LTQFKNVFCEKTRYKLVVAFDVISALYIDVYLPPHDKYQFRELQHSSRRHFHNALSILDS